MMLLQFASKKDHARTFGQIAPSEKMMERLKENSSVRVWWTTWSRQRTRCSCIDDPKWSTQACTHSVCGQSSHALL